MKKIIIREDQGNMLWQALSNIKDHISDMKSLMTDDFVFDDFDEDEETAETFGLGMNKGCGAGRHNGPGPEVDVMGKKKECACQKAKQYPINPEQVLIVKKFLDSNFNRGDFEEVGDDGLPKVTKIVIMKGPSGNNLQNMFLDQLEDLLQDKFRNMFSDEDQKRKFLGQVMRDWYDNKIGLYGSLSVNHL